ncbi:LacI family DNA-binding transcriptional regulator [Nakamurella sp.]|uniref:LacI family DNA-binding transcriptional regulator n=1 Tax=Nakamurella sp. TaxID=1869182 RepID=UPI003B3A856D
MTQPPLPTGPAPRVTLREVAERARVSRTTASFVLSGRRDMRISADAETRVRQAARELNYRPSLLARSLRTNSSQTIGLLSDQIASEMFAGEAVRGALTSALQHEHLLFVGETGGDPEVERSIIQGMLDRGVGGFVHASMYTQVVRIPAVLRRHPVVLMNSYTRGKRLPAVVPDETEAGRSVARELLAKGHRDGIVLVGEHTAQAMAGEDRLAGIREVLAAEGTDLAAVVDTLWWPDHAYRAMSTYLSSVRPTGPTPTAFICLNDRVAFGVYQALAEVGWQVPQDVSVISFDDSDLAAWLRPALTSVAIPYFEMGRRSVELLLAPEPPAVHLVPMPVHLRESVGPPR